VNPPGLDAGARDQILRLLERDTLDRMLAADSGALSAGWARLRHAGCIRIHWREGVQAQID
jgi:hypothetical protein